MPSAHFIYYENWPFDKRITFSALKTKIEIISKAEQLIICINLNNN